MNDECMLLCDFISQKCSQNNNQETNKGWQEKKERERQEMSIMNDESGYIYLSI